MGSSRYHQSLESLPDLSNYPELTMEFDQVSLLGPNYHTLLLFSDLFESFHSTFVTVEKSSLGLADY